jgi:hypothetical protein
VASGRAALPELDVRETRSRASLLGLFQHLGSQIEGHDFARSPRQRGGYNARTAGDIEDGPPGCRAEAFDQPRRQLLVCDRGRRRERVGLPGKFPLHALELIH